MSKKVVIRGIEFSSKVTLGSPSLKIIELLLDLNEDNSLSAIEIFEEINKKKKGKIYSLASVSRCIKSLITNEPDKLKIRKIGRTSYYWITPLEIALNSKTKTTSKIDVSNNDSSKVSIIEKDLYPEVQEWLNKLPLDGLEFRYIVTGGGFIDKSKYSNPDIIGTNIQGNRTLVVSVEVKALVNNESELTGFAQCCSYKLFSDYVFLFCYKPNSSDRVGRLINMCQFYGIGLKFLDDDKLILEPEINQLKIGDANQKHKIIEKLKSNSIG
jgi:hypothetical protein